MSKTNHNLKNNKTGFAILAALLIVVIFSIAISEWISTDSIASKFKTAPVIYAKNLVQAQQINNMISSSENTFNAFARDNSGSCPPENSACSKYIYTTQPIDNLCTFSSQKTALNNKRALVMVWCKEDCESSSLNQIQLTTCVSDQDGENIAVSIWRISQKDGSLKLIQEDEF